MFFGLVLLLNLIFKKVPYLVEINKGRYEKEREEMLKKGKEVSEGWQDSFPVYLTSNLFKTMALDIYVMVFAFLTILHPLFAGF